MATIQVTLEDGRELVVTYIIDNPDCYEVHYAGTDDEIEYDTLSQDDRDEIEDCIYRDEMLVDDEEPKVPGCHGYNTDDYGDTGDEHY